MQSLKKLNEKKKEKRKKNLPSKAKREKDHCTAKPSSDKGAQREKKLQPRYNLFDPCPRYMTGEVNATSTSGGRANKGPLSSRPSS